MIYSLDVFPSHFESSPLPHIQFELLLLDLHTGFSGDRLGGLVFPSLSEYSTIFCDPHSQRLYHRQWSIRRCFSRILLFFYDPMDVGNLISSFSVFYKSRLNIWNFLFHVLLKPILENFERFTLLVCEMSAWRRQWQATPVLLPRKSHGWRSLVGFSPWGRYQSDATEQLHFHFSLSCNGEGNGNSLQCSCLENPWDGRVWWAAVYGVAQSRTWLKRLSSSSSRDECYCWLFV